MLCRFFSFITVLSLFAGSALADTAVPVITSTVSWVGKKVTGQHSGKIALKEGTLLKNEQGDIIGGNFVIDMSSISVEDIKEADGNQKLLNHLKSDDFFAVTKHPTANLKITSAKKDADGAYAVSGDLTIKGVTHPIQFKATAAKDGDQNKFDAKINVDRTKYDVKYGSGKFFENLGDKLIYDDFELNVSLATK